MDYGLPRAADFPALGFESHPMPASTNPLGAKGCREAGCAGSLPAVMNAVVNALSEFGIGHTYMPATPHRGSGRSFRRRAVKEVLYWRTRSR
jgi:carbon-monoxide dehydrogenase large subunit